MEKIELQLDHKTLEKALALAKSRDCNLSELVAYAIDQLAVAKPKKDNLLGAFADDPDAVDAMLEEVIKDRAAGNQKSVEQLNKIEDILLGQAAQTALSQSTMVGTENFTSALGRLANGEA